jgi:mRNA deadenylase 3'-5' endonuclease subunit Ccr4
LDPEASAASREAHAAHPNPIAPLRMLRHTQATTNNAAMFSSSATNVRVTTYNILSSKLARKEHFQACNEEDLKPHVRYQRIINKLEVELQKDAVLCLQEVRAPSNPDFGHLPGLARVGA